MSRHIGGDPAPQTGHSDPQAYKKGYEAIDWGEPEPRRTGRHIMFDGRLIHINELPHKLRAHYRKADNKNFESVAMGCSPDQILGFKADLAKAGISGVDFTPEGNMVLADRKTKHEVMRLRGLHDKDEIKGRS